MEKNREKKKPFLAYEPVTFDNVFSVDDIQKIHNDVKNIQMQESGTGLSKNDSNIPPDIESRRSQVKWIPKKQNYKWIYNKLLNLAKKANTDYWNFHLTSFENIQYTIYNNKDYGSYNWHVDTLYQPDKDIIRKISIVCPLSNFNDYKGGQFMINFAGGPVLMDQKPGLVHIFPSWMPHGVNPVFEGTRKSLVLWISGPKYR